ncbi:MAG: MerR family transcriptional regulator [Bacteroidetes bacterium]|nr:MAG: MerR family transcriptional regulator [Bacteroidota bacterium]
MPNEEDLMSAEECCAHYQIELSFIQSLNEYGLIEINRIESTEFIQKDKLLELEKFIHLHYDLDINFAGLDAINHLLERIKDLQHELTLLKSKMGETN